MKPYCLHTSKNTEFSVEALDDSEIIIQQTDNENDFGFEDEANKSNESPLGEPWIMLAFAVMAAVVITLRKKQTA